MFSTEKLLFSRQYYGALTFEKKIKFFINLQDSLCRAMIFDEP